VKILAVDLGEKRTGLAMSDEAERMALAMPTLLDADAEAIARVAREHGVGLVVVGLPLNMDGSVGPRAQAAQEFARELQTLLPIPIATWDERLSSAEGDARLREAGLRRKERARRSDAAAAIVILEAFLSARRRGESRI
jgi:putative Holliday junction resolvase